MAAIDLCSGNEEQANVALQWTRPGVFLVVVFFFTGLNAGSFFVRSDSPWQRLTGETKGLLLTSMDVQLGFPLPFAFTPGRGMLTAEQWTPFVSNVVCTVVVALAYAFMFVPSKQPVAKVTAGVAVVEKPSRWQWRIRFRLSHMLAITTVTAVMLGLFSHAPDPALRALKLVYLAGPCAVLWMFYFLRSWPWCRVAMILVACLLLAGVTAISAERVFGDFTYGLFGLFVCWFPQLMLIILLIFISRNIQAARQAIEYGQ